MLLCHTLQQTKGSVTMYTKYNKQKVVLLCHTLQQTKGSVTMYTKYNKQKVVLLWSLNTTNKR